MDEKRNDKKPGNPWTKSLLIWVAVLFGLVLFVRAFDSGSAAQGEPLAYSDFVNQVDEGNVRSVIIATSAKVTRPCFSLSRRCRLLPKPIAPPPAFFCICRMTKKLMPRISRNGSD